MSYVIVTGDSQSVEKKVNNLLSIGFNLHGSMSFVMSGTNSFKYTQPMSHLQPNLVKTLTVKHNSTKSVLTIDVIVVPNSQKLKDLLQNYDGDESRWMHCKLISDMSTDIFVLDEQNAFDDLNIGIGFDWAMPEKKGGRRSKRRL